MEVRCRKGNQALSLTHPSLLPQAVPLPGGHCRAQWLVTVLTSEAGCFVLFCFVYGHARGMWKFPGQHRILKPTVQGWEWNPRVHSNPSMCSQILNPPPQRELLRPGVLCYMVSRALEGGGSILGLYPPDPRSPSCDNQRQAQTLSNVPLPWCRIAPVELTGRSPAAGVPVERRGGEVAAANDHLLRNLLGCVHKGASASVWPSLLPFEALDCLLTRRSRCNTCL